MDSDKQGWGERAAQKGRWQEQRKQRLVSPGQWPLVLGGEEVGAREMGQSGQTVGGGFPVSAEGWGKGVGGGGESRFQRRGVTGAK